MSRIADEPTLALIGIEAGTVDVHTTEGMNKSLIFRLRGRIDFQGPVVTWRVAIHSAEVQGFLAVIMSGAEQIVSRAGDQGQ
jgi:hypothetical protein